MKHIKKSPSIIIKSALILFAFYGALWFVLTLITVLQTPIPETNNYQVQNNPQSQTELAIDNRQSVEKLQAECPYTQKVNWEIPVFMYHHIQDNVDPSNESAMLHSVEIANFRNQLDMIRNRGYTPVTFYHLVANCLPEKPIIITLDDGFLDAFNGAFPALVERNMVATFYISSNSIGSPAYMDWNQVNQLVEAGMEIGSHTLNHANLKIISPELQRTEILDSIAAIETQTGRDVISFAYPYGENNSPTLPPLLAEGGIKYAVIIWHVNANNNRNPMLTPRYLIDDTTDINEILK